MKGSDQFLNYLYDILKVWKESGVFVVPVVPSAPPSRKAPVLKLVKNETGDRATLSVELVPEGTKQFKIYGSVSGAPLLYLGPLNVGQSRLSGVMKTGTLAYAAEAVYEDGSVGPLSEVVSVSFGTPTTPPAEPTIPTEPSEPDDEDNNPPEPPDHEDNGTPTTPTTPTEPTTGGEPSIDLAKWKLTIPVVSGGKVQEIKPPDLANYRSEFFQLATGKKGRKGYRFRCFHGGGTTSGSSNPRSELRQRVKNDPEGYWDSKNLQTFRCVLSVERLTAKRGHTVISQIHGGKDDTQVWRLERNKLWLTNGNDNNWKLVDPNFVLGDIHTLEYKVDKGVIKTFYDGKAIAELPMSGTGYFKAGAYLQSNEKTAPGESTSEYTDVIIYELSATES